MPPAVTTSVRLPTLRRERIGKVVGRLSETDLQRIDDAVLRWLRLRA